MCYATLLRLLPLERPLERLGRRRPEIGRPPTLRDNWLDRLPAGSDATTNGAAGVTSGDFTLYAAEETSHGNLTYSYWSYLNGPERHAYIVYDGAPPGAPGGGVSMEQYIASYLEALA